MTTENDCAFMFAEKNTHKYTKAQFISDSL